MYDDERNCEYPPLRCMNDDVIAARINNPDAKQCVFAIAASAKLNSDIAVNLKTCLTSGSIDLLLSKDDGFEKIAQFVPEYLKVTEPEERLFYEKPYLETMMLVSEMVRLTYERKENTGAIVVRERGSETKDRYTSVSYGAYFASLLSRDLLSDDGNGEQMPSCVSSVTY